MVIRSVIPVMLVSLTFFVLLLQMVDLFANLWRYLNQEVPLLSILRIQLLYLPKCASYSIPIALLFSISYTLGDSYSKNELIAVFGSGISLYRFIVPILIIGGLFSFMGFYFDDKIVIDTFKQKNDLVRTVLQHNTTFSNTNVTILGDDIRMVYHADYFNDQNNTLSGLIVIKRDREGGFLARLDAETAVWKGTQWQLNKVRSFFLEGGSIREEEHETYEDPSLSASPNNFRKIARNMDEMKIDEARDWITTLKKAGLSYREALTEYYKRFSFAVAPFVVAILSSAIGGRFRKNILLMSLLSSLCLSVIYYVVQMIMLLLAKLGYIAPIAGAWSSFFIFLIIGLFLMRFART
jgi:lipopolysaccharide export system permease protein